VNVYIREFGFKQPYLHICMPISRSRTLGSILTTAGNKGILPCNSTGFLSTALNVVTLHFLGSKYETTRMDFKLASSANQWIKLLLRQRDRLHIKHIIYQLLFTYLLRKLIDF
jgi:hypothetical protein